jgi:predicted metalloprotease with PDZ domain
VGDEIIAMDGWRVDAASLPELLKALAPGQTVSVHSARDGRLREAELTLDAAPADTCTLALAASDDPMLLQQRAAWLGA